MTPRRFAIAGAFLLTAGVLKAQPARKPFEARATSTLTYSVKDSEQIVDIHNVSYEVSGDSVPGRAAAERLVLRKTTSLKHILGDKGSEAKVTLEAWPLGADIRQ
jgi:hypothetical protein